MPTAAFVLPCGIMHAFVAMARGVIGAIVTGLFFLPWFVQRFIPLDGLLRFPVGWIPFLWRGSTAFKTDRACLLVYPLQRVLGQPCGNLAYRHGTVMRLKELQFRRCPLVF